MNIYKNFNNYDFIKLDEMNISDAKIVVLYARFMHNSGAAWTLDTHSHSFYEIHFPLNGSCNLVLQNKQEATLSVGDSLLIYPNTNHKFTRFSNNFFRLSIAFDIQYNNKIIAKDDKYVITESCKNITYLLKQILSEYNTQNPGYLDIAKLYIQSVMIETLRNSSDILYDDKIYSETNSSVFNTALHFIRNNISLSINAEDVARSVNLSSRQLNRIFCSNLNMTISEFIRNERIIRVQEHLKKTNLTLQEIASLTGFNDEYILCKTFKKIIGTTPRKYRTNHKKKG